jgi:hypothetical protein
MKTLEDAEKASPSQLKGMTPPQVDELFAAVYEVSHGLYLKTLDGWDDLRSAAGDKRDPFTRAWGMMMSEVEKKAKARAATDPHSDAARAIAYLEKIQAERERLDRGVWAKLLSEFDRRGGWPRAYLAITNGKGHVHRTDNCSTCHRGAQRTRLHWMIEYSGKTQKKIIEAAGERACTVCYPDAPVSDRNRPTQMFSPDEIEADKARKERAAAKAVRDAKKAEKSITDADGGPLRVHTWTKKAHQKQVRGKLVDVPEQSFHDTLTTTHAARAWLTDQFEAWRGENGSHRDVGKVADAIALKESKTRDQVIDEAKIRAKKRGR